MTVFDLLIKDHEKVKQLYEKLQNDENMAEEDRAKLAEEIGREVFLHSKAEGEAFYEEVKNLDSLKGLIDHSYEEHAKVEKLLDKMTDQIQNGEEWEETLDDMMENLFHHIDEEENKLFPKVKENLEAGLDEKMAEQFESLKNELK